MVKSTKLAELIVEETSGVDHPAHLHEGWIVMKSTELDEALDSLDETVINDLSTDEGEPIVELTQNETETVTETEEVVADVETEAQPVLASVDVPDDDNTATVEKMNTDLRKALSDLAEVKKQNEQLVEERELEKASSAGHQWAILPGMNPSEFAPVLRSIRSNDAESAQKVEEIFDACAVAFSEAGIMKELGSDAAPEGEGAYAMIEASAQELVSSGEVDSIAKGIAIVAQRQPDLYGQYMKEKGL